LVGFSAFVFTLAAISWWRSYRVYDRFAHISHDYHGNDMTRRTWQMVTVRGAVVLNASLEVHRGPFRYLSAEQRAMSESLPRLRWAAVSGRTAPQWRLPSRSPFHAIGFGYTGGYKYTRLRWFYDDPPGIALRIPDPAVGWWASASGATASVPHWFICVVTSILPATAIPPAVRRWLRRRRGLCPTCGYDLRASRDRCPECGRPIAVIVATSPPVDTP
jgi:hypothetical protein